MAAFFVDRGVSVMKDIDVKSRLYDYKVCFINDFEAELRTNDRKCTYVIDRNVYGLYQDRFKHINQDCIFFVDANESKKTMDTVMDIISFWKKMNVQKDWQAVCFGGGITQDVTTIASNLYLRNIDWIFFPTTLLAMCDSCIGGKCGINFDIYKNQIGVFYPPKEVMIDTAFLSSLTKEDYLNGWGEIFKFSLTSEPEFFNDVEKISQYIPFSNIDECIYRGLLIKKNIIEKDEFESDLRRVLNYGHTFGHALEAYTKNRIPHGKGVIWGIDVVNYISMKENLIPEKLYLEIKSLIKRAFLQNEIVIDRPDELFEIIRTDKKVKGETISLALLNGRSRLIVYPMKIDNQLKAYFEEYLETTHEFYRN